MDPGPLHSCHGCGRLPGVSGDGDTMVPGPLPAFQPCFPNKLQPRAEHGLLLRSGSDGLERYFVTWVTNVLTMVSLTSTQASVAAFPRQASAEWTPQQSCICEFNAACHTGAHFCPNVCIWPLAHPSREFQL